MSAIGNLSLNMSSNYNEHGVDEYYKKVAASYRNPHFPGVKKVIFELMNRWWAAEGERACSERDGGLQVLDMAAGSGEATICLQEWYQTGRALNDGRAPPSSLDAPVPAQVHPAHPLAALGGGPSTFRPAFIPPGRAPVIPLRKSGLAQNRPTTGQAISQPAKLPSQFKRLQLTATDPYTSPAYLERTGQTCLPLSFQDLANGCLPATPAKYDLIICSFALHLVPSPSELFALLYALSERADWLVIIAPHKKPEIKETWGWARWDYASWGAVGEAGLYAGGQSHHDQDDEEAEKESDIVLVREKVKCRLYRSLASM